MASQKLVCSFEELRKITKLQPVVWLTLIRLVSFVAACLDDLGSLDSLKNIGSLESLESLAVLDSLRSLTIFILVFSDFQ